MEKIGLIRLANQHIQGQRFKSVTDVVDWMGAMQAQDLNSAKWAIGVRLPGSTEKDINSAIDNAEIIRTHLLRPTWHLVASDLYPILLALTAPGINKSLKYRRIQLNLDEVIFKKSNPALTELLKNGNHRTREEIMTGLAGLIPDLDSSKMNHILMEAEMNGLICSGKIKNKIPTYALVQERIENYNHGKENFDHEAALKIIASRYFKSHGPATLSDFIWWSGLTAAECRKAHDMVKDELTAEKYGTIEYWLDKESFETERSLIPEVALLPAFDEFIIAYKDRSSVITGENHDMAVSSNGIFRPVVVYDGQVIGLWNKAIRKDKLQVTINYFIKPAKSIQTKLKASVEEYAVFLGLKKSEIMGP